MKKRLRKKTILLVEDNPDDVTLTLRAFSKIEILNEIKVVNDGAEALDYLLGITDPEQLPAVILLDLKLPKVDGLTVLQRVREYEPTRFVPVVILTSSREEQDLVRGYGLGTNSYIRKPVNFEEFAHTVSQLGSYWLLLNEPVPPQNALGKLQEGDDGTIF